MAAPGVNLEFAFAACGMVVAGAACLISAARRGEFQTVAARTFLDALLNGGGFGTAIDFLYAVIFNVSHLVHITHTGDAAVTVSAEMSTVRRIELMAGCLTILYVTSINILTACRHHRPAAA